MFERFTEQARQVVVLAQEEARLLHHNYIGTEHLLLGLLREADGLAARVLESLDISLDRVRSSAQQEGQRQIEAVRQAKEQAIEAKQFDSAAQLRDQERALREHARAESEVRIDEALDSIRRRLGIPSSSGDPPPGHRASQDEPD